MVANIFMTEKQKNKNAVALGKLRLGVKEIRSEKKIAAIAENARKGRERWSAMTPEERKHKKTK